MRNVPPNQMARIVVFVALFEWNEEKQKKKKV